MTSIDRSPDLGVAASHFLAELPPEEAGVSRQEVYKFIRWFGRERPFSGLTAAEIDNYAEQMSLSDTDYMRKLELLKAFLVYAKKKGWSRTNLATHLKPRKGKSKSRPLAGKVSRKKVSLTREGYAGLEAELATLKKQRREVIEEIRKAAADKDFRENAPLQAARERRGQIEGQIIELEETLKSAVIIDEKQETSLRVDIGNSIVLCDLDSGEEVSYMLVSPKEVDPTRGKISSASPIGKAVIGKEQGETVEIEAPAGKLHYQIKRIEN